jgi:hypothetical protein
VADLAETALSHKLPLKLPPDVRQEVK